MNKKNNEDYNTEDRVSNLSLIFSNFINPKIILGIVLVYAGLGVPYLLTTESDINILFKTHGPTLLGVGVALMGFVLSLSELSKMLRLRREDRFIDVDKNRDSEILGFQSRILKEINSIKQKSDILSAEKVELLISEALDNKLTGSKNRFESFDSYFNDVINILTEQAHTADRKASMLLDKGTAYSKWGLIFFIVSIIAWQVLSWNTGFQEQYIYGIISCSLLFVFIEFLAAWFLKQYRHFVDTSTYHIKVKSIFDKYMMSYLAIKSLSSGESSVENKYQAMLKILDGDIKWPETFSMKNGDLNFARETLETLTHFAKSMRTDSTS